ncbi:hypothetical protein [Micromonospora sp. U56]|uniref:hypothetical protein n=1 Tax=Micromonospora sp. U56 TaxID=2824900 RepID=UPI001B369F04|nr:hypothetical protein [Micromonospora sp. U56]
MLSATCPTCLVDDADADADAGEAEVLLADGRLPLRRLNRSWKKSFKKNVAFVAWVRLGSEGTTP